MSSIALSLSIVSSDPILEEKCCQMLPIPVVAEKCLISP